MTDTPVGQQFFNTDQNPIESAKEFKRTPTGWYRRWATEMTASNKRMRRWHKQGKKIQARYADRRGMQGSQGYTDDDRGAGGNMFRVNLFNSNINTTRSMLYGSTPSVDVNRRFADADDDPARVGSLIFHRMLNTSIEASGDDYKSALQYCLDDRLLAGLGIARVRYEFKSEEIAHEEIVDENNIIQAEAYTEEKLLSESAPVDYVHWDDFRWGWARTWSAVPWIAFRSFMTKDEATKRFGKEMANQLTYKNKTVNQDVETRLTSDESSDAWERAEIWEIWDKTTKQVFWWSHGFQRILDRKKDPLGLFGFWPTPEPMLSNTTSNLLLPQPDFVIAQDLYNEIDQLETRIGIITTAVRVVGVYDEANDGVKRMLEEGFENDLIPMKSWAKFAEKGGLEGTVDWLPIQDMVEALVKLVEMRTDAMQLLYEVTGMSDIIRGASGPSRETASAADSKKTFASIRVQALQEDFARFGSDLMTLRAEVISRHFEEKTIIQESNILHTADGKNKELIQAAMKLIKEPVDAAWRIEIRPETVAMVDYDRMRKERGEFIQSVATFMQSATPLVELDPNATPTLIAMLKWAVAGFKGSREIEGVLDEAIEQMQKAAEEAQKNPQPEPPSPEEVKAAAEEKKAANAAALEDKKHQHNMELEMGKFQANTKEILAELQSQLKVIQAEMMAAIQGEIAQSEAAMTEDDHSTQNKIKVKKTATPTQGNKSDD